MRIFFLTQFYYNLHEPIIKELKSQGHQVFLVEDIILPFDPNFREKRFWKKMVCTILRKLWRTELSYWKRKVESSFEYCESYDVFLCIDGTSFHPYLLDFLKRRNPNIKSTLYLWDTNRYYNFMRFSYCFNKIFTFDLDDSLNLKGVNLLPSYWFPSITREVKYNLCSIGSDHDGRLNVISKLYHQMEEAQLNCYLKVVINKPVKKEVGFLSFFEDRKYKKNLKLWEMKSNFPFTTEEHFPIDVVIRLIDESECVLDIDKPIQSGATQRVIWALARGKKVISTNSNLKRMPFYNSHQIIFLDRNNPILDVSFIKKKETFSVCEDIEMLRIDKWVNFLIDF